MTKIFIIGFALALFFALPSSISARSGCCSSHSGVDCAAGPQSDGRVICNDGWLGSSCYYSEMVMCAGYSIQTVSTPTPSPIAPMPTPALVTLKPTLKTTPKSTITPTPTSTSTPSPEVRSAVTEAAPSPTPLPTTTAGDVVGGLAVGAGGLGLGYLGLKWLARVTAPKEPLA